MLRATLTAAALTAASLMPLAAQAQATTEVTMLGRGYFPNKINVDPGGSIVFHNASDVPMAATALDDSWTTGWVFPGNRKTIVLPEEGGLVFNNRINALDALLGTEPEFFNEAMIITDGSTEDLLSPAVEPLDTDTLLALYGPRISTPMAMVISTVMTGARSWLIPRIVLGPPRAARPRPARKRPMVAPRSRKPLPLPTDSAC